MTPALTEDAAGPDTFVKGRRTGSFQANHCHSNKPTHTDTSATRARTFVRLAFISYQPIRAFNPLLQDTFLSFTAKVRDDLNVKGEVIALSRGLHQIHILNVDEFIGCFDVV